MVEKYKGDKDDAKDVFQEAVIIIFRKIKNESFQLTSTFKTYLYSVSWYIWMKELRDRDNEFERSEEYKYLEDHTDNIQIEYELNRRYKLYQENFKKLGKDCRKILNMYFKQVPLKKIAKKMGYKSEPYVKKRKYLCKEKLVKLIRNDKRFDDYHE